MANPMPPESPDATTPKTEILRRAAASIRTDYADFGPDEWEGPFYSAVAVWLDNSAAFIEAEVPGVVVAPGCYAVARAYFGEDE